MYSMQDIFRQARVLLNIICTYLNVSNVCRDLKLNMKDKNLLFPSHTQVAPTKIGTKVGAKKLRTKNKILMFLCIAIERIRHSWHKPLLSFLY